VETEAVLLLKVEMVAKAITHLLSPCLHFQILQNLSTKVDRTQIGLKLADLMDNLSEVPNSQPLILLKIPMATLLRAARRMVLMTLFASLVTSKSQSLR